MENKNNEFKFEKETMFLQENRQRLVKSIADQIYNTILSRTASQKGKSKEYFCYKSETMMLSRQIVSGILQ